jgi:hypothetical protein
MRITDYHSKGAGHPFSGSRVTIRVAGGQVVDAFEVPSWYGLQYIKRHPGGKYAARFKEACDRARALEAQG